MKQFCIADTWIGGEWVLWDAFRFYHSFQEPETKLTDRAQHEFGRDFSDTSNCFMANIDLNKFVNEVGDYAIMSMQIVK